MVDWWTVIAASSRPVSEVKNWQTIDAETESNCQTKINIEDTKKSDSYGMFP